MFERYDTLQLLCKQQRDADNTLRTKIMLGEEDLILLTKKVGEPSYSRKKIDTFGELPEFDFNVIWPPEATIPLTTPPKGRKPNKRRKKPPDTSSSNSQSC